MDVHLKKRTVVETTAMTDRLANSFINLQRLVNAY